MAESIRVWDTNSLVNIFKYANLKKAWLPDWLKVHSPGEHYYHPISLAELVTHTKQSSAIADVSAAVIQELDKQRHDKKATSSMADLQFRRCSVDNAVFNQLMAISGKQELVAQTNRGPFVQPPMTDRQILALAVTLRDDRNKAVTLISNDNALLWAAEQLRIPWAKLGEPPWDPPVQPT